MAKKNAEQRLKELQEQERKLKEEMKAARQQMLKEERAERKKCYLEIGKQVESCLKRNLREDDIETFAVYVLEHEDEIAKLFEESDASAADEEENEEDIFEEEEPLSGSESEENPYGDFGESGEGSYV